MRAALLEASGSPMVVVDDLVREDPRVGEVVVDVHHCGVCHSDLSHATGAVPAPVPVVLGHEAAGVVAELGPGVTGLAVGDHVVLTPCPPCGRCPWCVRGQFSLCRNSDSIMTNAHPDGGTRLSHRGRTVARGVGMAAFADQVVIQAEGAVRIPDGVTLATACVVGCAVQTGVGAVLNTARVRAGDTVLVTGLGGVGLSAVQGARVAGASLIVAVDPVAERRDRALAMGATHAVDPGADDVVDAARDLTGGLGVDCAFEAAGRSALLNVAFDAVRKGGTAVLVGAPALDDPFTLPIPALLAAAGKRLVGTLLGDCHSGRDIPRFLDLAAAGRLDLDGLVTAHRPLDAINDAFDDLAAGRGIRTVIDLQEAT